MKPKSTLGCISLLVFFCPQIHGIAQDQSTQQSTENRVDPDLIDGETKEDQSSSSSSNKEKPRAKFKFKKHGALVYDRGEDYRLTLDVYQPEGNGPFPAVLAVHGGAWRSGSKITMLRHAWELASAGYVVVAINYRHAPKYKFPAQIHDCKQAVRWIRYHADQYSIDPNRVAAFGYSAGGHLVSLLGTADAEDGLEGPIKDERLEDISTRVQAVIAGGAVCDFKWVDPESRILNYWIGTNRGQDPAAYLKASPTHYISKDDPPFFFFHGEEDAVVPISSPKNMHQKLVDMGIPSQFNAVSGKGHLATFGDIKQMNKCIEFLNQRMPDLKTDSTKTSVGPAKSSAGKPARKDN